MTEQILIQAEAIFQAAVDLPAADRRGILAERCGTDQELRSLVEDLLHHHDSGMPGFLEAPEGLDGVSDEGFAIGATCHIGGFYRGAATVSTYRFGSAQRLIP